MGGALGFVFQFGLSRVVILERGSLKSMKPMGEATVVDLEEVWFVCGSQADRVVGECLAGLETATTEAELADAVRAAGFESRPGMPAAKASRRPIR